MLGRRSRSAHKSAGHEQRRSRLQRVEDAIQAERTRRDDEFAQALDAWRKRSDEGAQASGISSTA